MIKTRDVKTPKRTKILNVSRTISFTSNDVILNEALQGRSILGNKVLLADVGNVVGLRSCNLVLREVSVHLVSVEVSVVGLAARVMKTHDTFAL